MKTFLLDVNVLLALAWPNHPFHNRATMQVRPRKNYRWATCLLTQAAFVRLSSNPAVIPGAKSPAEAGEMLSAMIADSGHVFLEPKPGQFRKLLELLQRCHDHNQINDAFLVWIAQSRGATVLTFDSPLQHLPATAGVVEVIS